MADEGKKRVRPRRMITEETTELASMSVFKPTARTRQMVLKQITGPGSPRDLELDRRLVIVGRSSKGVDISIDSPALSRRHIALEYDGAEYQCTDLGSQNGLYLNGIEIHSCILRHGDTIQIGDVSFVFREAGD